MKRAARIFVHAAAGVSLLLCLLAVGLWIVSYRSRYTLVETGGWSDCMVAVSGGELGCIFDRYPMGPMLNDSSAYGWHWTKSVTGDLGEWVRAYFEDRRSPVCGFFFGRQQNELRTVTILLLPLPFLVAVFAPLPLADVLLIRRRRRRRRRAAAGLCVRCGYDLRASPDKCPECGSVPTAQAARLPGTGG